MIKMATALKEVLPPPKSSDVWFKQRYGGVVKTNLNPLMFDAIVRRDENAERIVYSQHRDLIPKILKLDDHENRKKPALETTKPLVAVQPHDAAHFIKYRHSGAMQRMIRMVETPVDPLEPPKFKHKRVPKGNRSPPVPLMHSPPRPLTVEDQKDWKVPPCVSNWKNPQGYTIPLDKRLAAADAGRGLLQVQVNDNFAQLLEALYVAEQRAREAVSMRSKVLHETMLKEKEKREQELRAMAQKARLERTAAGSGSGSFVTQDTQSNTQEREKIREERRKERERERRLEAKDAAMGKKRKIRDRDISEKVALGMASSAGCEVMYDQRLFNQEKGMDSGFGIATDDQYSVYDKGLFTAQPTTFSTLCRPVKDNSNISKTDRFDEREDADPFGLDQFLTQVKTGAMRSASVGY